jgi:uncharacterized protein YegL
MAGAKLTQLNAGLAEFERQLKSDPLAAKRAEVSIITFGPVVVQQDFVTADSFFAPTLAAAGDTPMGAAIRMAIDNTQRRKHAYKTNGVGYYRPWIFLITDGAPTDDVTDATAAIREGEASNQFSFYAVGVDSADMSRLKSIVVRDPLKLKGLSFRELFIWLSNSVSQVSRSQIGEQIALPNPAAPNGWATAG